MKNLFKYLLVTLSLVPTISFADNCNSLIMKEENSLSVFRDKNNALNLVMSKNSWIPQEFAVDIILKNKYVFDSYSEDIAAMKMTSQDNLCNKKSIELSIDALRILSKAIDVQIKSINDVSSQTDISSSDNKFKIFLDLEAKNMEPVLAEINKVNK